MKLEYAINTIEDKQKTKGIISIFPVIKLKLKNNNNVTK
ncbi:hypothetical protein TCEL_00322 [Thermobrachium celere DSM 8682]|uniref:Uncharacterized protein n=1 Tax=Thermobrachium celere DSM 8682 TaxID=941824 RepID=R7RSA9_9CLOT|nr:hypothetical protein TCEL_00322 [Thermobrachium celere DSM 8682]